jgi:hypothetical protein
LGAASTWSNSLLELLLLRQRGRAALEGQRAHGHAPAVVHGADDVLLGRLRAVEEHLGELAAARDLLDGHDGRRPAASSSPAGS